MTYTERLQLYEQKKREIAHTSRTSVEYERRIKALVKKLNI